MANKVSKENEQISVSLELTILNPNKKSSTEKNHEKQIPALLSNEMSQLLDIWNNKQFGHQVVPEIPRSNLHSFTGFTKLVNFLNI